MTSVDGGKLGDLTSDSLVNLGYYKDGLREDVSVSGRARVLQDKVVICRDLATGTER